VLACAGPATLSPLLQTLRGGYAFDQGRDLAQVRVNQHLGALRTGKAKSPKLQCAYDAWTSEGGTGKVCVSQDLLRTDAHGHQWYGLHQIMRLYVLQCNCTSTYTLQLHWATALI
jgi:hypothetical protein